MLLTLPMAGSSSGSLRSVGTGFAHLPVSEPSKLSGFRLTCRLSGDFRKLLALNSSFKLSILMSTTVSTVITCVMLQRALNALRCPPGDALVANLSGGELRRVALCRLLLQVCWRCTVWSLNAILISTLSFNFIRPTCMSTEVFTLDGLFGGLIAA